jgi:monoamine oxidase
LLVQFLADKARTHGAVLLNGVDVRGVRWRRGHVEVDTLRGGMPETFAGDAAIITLPLGVLKAGTVRFEPPVSEKREAINGIEFGHVVKIILTFRQCWWGADFGFVHSLDERIPTWWSNKAHPILVGWAGGTAADALLKCSAQELEDQSLDILQRAFSTPASEIRSQLVSVHSHNWAADPNIRGAYSYLPVNGLFLPRLLGDPVEDTLFFAGEATARDAQMGTVFGALESGQRAARELLPSAKTKNRLARTRAGR